MIEEKNCKAKKEENSKDIYRGREGGRQRGEEWERETGGVREGEEKML